MIDNDKNSEIEELLEEETVEELVQDSESLSDEIIEEQLIVEEPQLKEETSQEVIEEIDYNDRVLITEQEPLPQYEESYEQEVVQTQPQPLPEKEQPTEKKDFLSTITKRNDLYVDYKTRLIGQSLVFVTLFIITVIFLQGTFATTPSQKIDYNESSNLDYRVYLKPNNFYETEYLGKNKVYIANLIDNIEINFNYRYMIAQPSDINFNYNIVAKLTINDGSGKNTYFEKEYTLLANKAKSIKSGTNYNINEKVSIDYAYYNSLANSFKQQFGLDTTSNLTVYLKVNKRTNIENATNNLENSTMFVKIPLSEKAINIELNYQDINNANYIIQGVDSKVDNTIFGILSAITLILSLVLAVRIIRLLTMLNGKKTIYDKYIERILNEYDRLIVENGTGPDTRDCQVIKISKFEELLDVRDNLKLPIMYYVVTKHTKCQFYIKHDDELYLLTIKAVDLEQTKEHK